jgi:hypothetical protein
MDLSSNHHGTFRAEDRTHSKQLFVARCVAWFVESEFETDEGKGLPK